tara:strand:+ start:3175 stop:3330 length:156 start_codon:yes stop_codon:yes gene_type:complete
MPEGEGSYGTQVGRPKKKKKKTKYKIKLKKRTFNQGDQHQGSSGTDYSSGE